VIIFLAAGAFYLAKEKFAVGRVLCCRADNRNAKNIDRVEL